MAWLAQIYDSGRDFQIEFGAVYGVAVQMDEDERYN
jgi:hypothetical protein